MKKDTLIVAATLSLGLQVGFATVSPAQNGAQRLNLETATPAQVGTRYGQAAGIALVCYGLKVTPKVDKLKNKFSGADRTAFNTQAAKVLAAWEKTLRCENSNGPNECKLSHTWSCQEGLKELGPQGTVLPGLVEQRVK